MLTLGREVRLIARTYVVRLHVRARMAPGRGYAVRAQRGPPGGPPTEYVYLHKTSCETYNVRVKPCRSEK